MIRITFMVICRVHLLHLVIKQPELSDPVIRPIVSMVVRTTDHFRVYSSPQSKRILNGVWNMFHDARENPN